MFECLYWNHMHSSVITAQNKTQLQQWNRQSLIYPATMSLQWMKWYLFTFKLGVADVRRLSCICLQIICFLTGMDLATLPRLPPYLKYVQYIIYSIFLFTVSSFTLVWQMFCSMPGIYGKMIHVGLATLDLPAGAFHWQGAKLNPWCICCLHQTVHDISDYKMLTNGCGLKKEIASNLWQQRCIEKTTSWSAFV